MLNDELLGLRGMCQLNAQEKMNKACDKERFNLYKNRKRRTLSEYASDDPEVVCLWIVTPLCILNIVLRMLFN